MKKKILVLFFSVAILATALGILWFYVANFSSSEEISIDKILIKSVIKEGEELNQSFSITNLGEKGSFNVNVFGLENLVSISEENFYLGNSESKEIWVSFLGENAKPGIYFGSINILEENGKKTIPTVLEVQTPNPYFAVSIDADSKYKEIKSGGKITAVVNFFNLKDAETHLVDVEYKIIGQNSEKVFAEKENIAVGSKSSITKIMQIPKNAENGNYVFTTTADFQNSTGTTSYFFTVSNKINFRNLISKDFFQISILILLFMIVFVIIYILMERKNILSKLKKQQKYELKFYTEKIEKQKKDLIERAKTEKEKKKIIENYKKAKNKILKGIKKEHARQKMELVKLAVREETKQADKNLKKWKKETYEKILKKSEINQELRAKFAAIKRAYSEKYISKNSYKKVKKRLSKKIKS